MTPLALRTAALLALVTAVTTFLLWWLPQLTPPGLAPAETRARPEYIGRLWVNFVHVFLALFAYGVAAALLARRSAVLAATGFVAFAFWALVEAIGVAVNLFAVSAWRAAPASPATDALIAWYPAWWDALFFVLLCCFLVGTTALGAAAATGRGVERAVGVLMLLAAPLTILIILDGYFGVAVAGGLVAVAYPILQPVSRALLGVWLWREAGVRAAR